MTGTYSHAERNGPYTPPPPPGAGYDREPAPMTLGELTGQFPTLRPVLIEGLLRRGETMNVIAASKTGKSWLINDLAIAVATGRPWLGRFPTVPGKVLIIDNELHEETLASRLRTVANARTVPLNAIAGNIFVKPLRGRLRSLPEIRPMLAEWGYKPGDFSLLVFDALYRLYAPGMDENGNAEVAGLYNLVDQIAADMGAGIALVHHASKGNQTDKSVTDVGSGAGAISRAADTHLILRPHLQPDVAVVEAVIRSFPPIEPVCVRWAFPTWNPADDLNPGELGDAAAKRKREADERRQAQSGTEMLAMLDQLDPDHQGYGVTPLADHLGWGRGRLVATIAPYQKSKVLEWCDVVAKTGNSATRTAKGVRRRTGSSESSPPPATTTPDLDFDAPPQERPEGGV